MAPRRDRLRPGQPRPGDRPGARPPHAAVVATGRSDFPNQINNVLAFPGVFRGLLDAQSRADPGEAPAGRRRGARRRRQRRRARTPTTSSPACSTRTWRRPSRTAVRRAVEDAARGWLTARRRASRRGPVPDPCPGADDAAARPGRRGALVPGRRRARRRGGRRCGGRARASSFRPASRRRSPCCSACSSPARSTRTGSPTPPTPSAGGWTVERRLEILDDPRHGTYGVAALCGSIVLRVVAVASLAPAAAFAGLVAAHALGRGAAVVAMGVAAGRPVPKASAPTTPAVGPDGRWRPGSVAVAHRRRGDRLVGAPAGGDRRARRRDRRRPSPSRPSAASPATCSAPSSRSPSAPPWSS